MDNYDREEAYELILGTMCFLMDNAHIINTIPKDQVEKYFEVRDKLRNWVCERADAV